MKFEIKEWGDGISLRLNGKVVITVWKAGLPDNWDAKRWVRLIVKTERMEGILRYMLPLDRSCRLNEIPYTIADIKSTLDYIKNGDEEEVSVECDGKTIKVRKRSAMKLRDSLNNLLK